MNNCVSALKSNLFFLNRKEIFLILLSLILLNPLLASAETMVPRMILADGYTIVAGGESGFTSKEAIEKSVYHIYFRRELTPWMKKMDISSKDSRFVFYGLQRIIDRIITPKVTQEEIDLADAFFKKHHFTWPKELWQRVVAEKNGHIPIKIEALKEGSVAFSGEPVIQITAEDGFGDLAAWFESTLLQVWAPSERATLVRYWLDYHKTIVEQCLEFHENPNESEIITRAQQLMVDMGARSCRSTQDMLDLGLASMLSLNSATPGSVFLANQGEEKVLGELAESALAHRIVQAYEDEGEAYARLYEFVKSKGEKFGSFVADCYDYENAVREYLLPLAKRGLKDGITVYVRPDSGDSYDTIVFVLNLAKEHGLSREIIIKDGRKLTAMTSLKVIQAEGMDFEKVKEINGRLFAAGYSPAHCVVYGVGGSLQHISRDNMSAAQKLAAVGKHDRPVMKIAIPEKESIPGVVKIVRAQDGSATVRTLQEEGDNEYVIYYDYRDGKSPKEFYNEKFSDIQKRVILEFHKVIKPVSITSQGILEKKIAIRQKYNKRASTKALFIVGPSGVGKSTCIQRIIQESNGKIKRGISYTTRAPRHNEKDGVDYHFVSQEQFNRMKANNEFITSADEFGHSYGLSYQEIEQAKEGIFIKDVGFRSIEVMKEKLGKNCFFIFLAPPSYNVLEARLKSRSLETNESEASLKKRLKDAAQVISYEPQCDMTIVAEEVNTTVKKIQAVIKSLKSDESLEGINTKDIPKKKLEKYNTTKIVRYKFTQEGLEELKNLYHELPINPLVMEIYNFKNESVDVKIQKDFKNLVAWDKERRFFIQPTPVYGNVDLLHSNNLPYLKYSENGVHLELWTTHSGLLKNSNFEHYWFGSGSPQEKKSTTFRKIENDQNPYLVSLLDLEQRHLPLLRSMREQVYENLKLYNVGKNDDVQLFFHFPYAPRTASLHLHIRVNQTIHPLEIAKSISLDKVIHGFERNQTINEIVLDHQELYKGYIYSDEATKELPQKVSTIITEVQTDLKLSSKVEPLNELVQLPISDESLQRIYLVRHGESTANVYFEVDGKKVRYVSGQSTNIPLTEIGKAQIQKLAEKLAIRFPKEARLIITSSSALRTQQTAKILFEELLKTHSNTILTEEVYQGLNERSLGEWEGKLKDERYTEAESAWRAMSAADKFISPEVEGGESSIKVADRALLALAKIYDRYLGGTVIAVTSFNTINATAIQVNNLSGSLSTIPGTNLPKLDLGNGDLVLLETFKDRGFEDTKVVSHIRNEK